MSTTDGLVDPAWWRSRQDDYLAAATTVSIPRSPLNVIDQLEWARRSPAHGFEAGVLEDESVIGAWCRRIDGYLDCADFDILRLLTLWFGYRDDRPPSVTSAIERRLLDFRYWFTDPGPPEGVVDERWYLAGQALPDATFTSTGMTGAEHRERASTAIVEWCDEKIRWGVRRVALRRLLREGTSTRWSRWPSSPTIRRWPSGRRRSPTSCCSTWRCTRSGTTTGRRTAARTCASSDGADAGRLQRDEAVLRPHRRAVAARRRRRTGAAAADRGRHVPGPGAEVPAAGRHPPHRHLRRGARRHTPTPTWCRSGGTRGR